MDDDLKIAVAVRDDLQTWQKLNVTAFLAGGLAAAHPDRIGSPYRDGDGAAYAALFAHPIVVLTGDADAMVRSLRRALQRDLHPALYIDAMFATGNDVDNRATVAAVRTDALVPAGLAVAGPRREVDKALDRLRMHT